MDISLIVSFLSLLVAALAESRNISKDRKFSNIRPLGISLLQLIFILDKIIATGDELLRLLAEIPLTGVTFRINVLMKKWEILKLIERQQKNLRDFTETCEAPLTYIHSVVSIKVGDVISLRIPDEVKEIPVGKRTQLKVLTWKLLEGEMPFSHFSLAARTALMSLGGSIQINKAIGSLAMKFPTKIMLKQEYVLTEPVIESQTFASYSLTKTSDLRRLLEVSKNQLDDIRNLRTQLSNLTSGLFTIGELAGKE